MSHRTLPHAGRLRPHLHLQALARRRDLLHARQPGVYSPRERCPRIDAGHLCDRIFPSARSRVCGRGGPLQAGYQGRNEGHRSASKRTSVFGRVGRLPGCSLETRGRARSYKDTGDGPKEFQRRHSDRHNLGSTGTVMGRAARLSRSSGPDV